MHSRGKGWRSCINYQTQAHAFIIVQKGILTSYYFFFCNFGLWSDFYSPYACFCAYSTLVMTQWSRIFEENGLNVFTVQNDKSNRNLSVAYAIFVLLLSFASTIAPLAIYLGIYSRFTCPTYSTNFLNLQTTKFEIEK